MERNFKKVIKLAEWLGHTEDVIKINKMEEIVNNGMYYITFWGHYSAGKSKLINNILKRDILPVQSRETTATLTYIMYGEDEGCTVYFENNAKEDFDLDYVKNIFQNTEDIKNIDAIDHIEIRIKNSLLKTGLVLVDTPGVNTIIQKHQDLAVSAIEQSGKIIYVMGGSPSNVDKKFINQITEYGIESIFVRTKCDKINESEENPFEAIQKEENSIKEIINKEVKFIGISNEKASSWFENISFIEEILEEFAQDLKKEMRESAEIRLNMYLKTYKEDLLNEKVNLENFINGNTIKIESELKKYNNELEKLKMISDNNEDKIKEEVEKANRDSMHEIKNLINRRGMKFEKTLEKIETPEMVEITYNNEIENSIEKIKEIFYYYFEKIIKNEIGNLNTVIQNNSLEIVTPQYSEIQSENSQILKMYVTQKIAQKEEIEKIIAEKSLNTSNLMDRSNEYNEEYYQNTLKEINEELLNIPMEIEMKESEDQGIQPSKVFKNIGNALDLALLFIPGEAIVAGVKGMADVTRIGQLINKSGQLAKAAGSLAKTAPVLDKVRDFGYAANQIFKKRGYATKIHKAQAGHLVNNMANVAEIGFDKFKESKRNGNLLDMLSVAYWAEKLGENFDSLPKMEVDREVEEQKRLRREELERKQREINKEKLKKQKELGLLKNRVAELEFLEKQKIQTLKKIEIEMEKEENQIKQNSKKMALEKYKEKFIALYKINIEKLANMLQKNYFGTANQNIVMYVEIQNKEISKLIKNKKEKLEDLKNKKEKGDISLRQRLEECDNLLKDIEVNE